MCRGQPQPQAPVVAFTIALPADAIPTDEYEGIATVLSERFDGRAHELDELPILNWDFAPGGAIIVTAPDGPVEGEILKGAQVVDRLTLVP